MVVVVLHFWGFLDVSFGGKGYFSSWYGRLICRKKYGE